MSIQSLEELLDSVRNDATPPAGSSPELQSVWLAKKGDWHAAHDIAQDIHTPLGSWIHAHLHLVEGDLGNARYWYARAGQPARGHGEEDDSWREVAEAVLDTTG